MNGVVAGIVAAAIAISSISYAETGKELFQQKCAMCHLTKKPTQEQKKNMIAPAAMGFMFHVKEKFKNDKQKAIAFIVDYVLHPSKEKSVCLPQTIKKFGVMPSQKGAVTKEELKKIAEYLWDNFPPKGFKHPNMPPSSASTNSEEALNVKELNGEQLAKRYGCFSCHAVDTIKKAPPFMGIARRATRRSSDPVGYIVYAIKNGRKTTMFATPMPAYPNISDEEALKIANWILSLKPLDFRRMGRGRGKGGGGMGGGMGRGMGRGMGMGMPKDF